MSQYIFEGKYEKSAGEIKVKLFLIHFIDENGIHLIFSPHLDITGYGNTIEDARSSFEIVLEDFVDYTLKEKTLGKVLSNLGWKIDEIHKNPRRLLAPSITSVIKDNQYVSDIFDKYQVNTFHQEVGIPAVV